MICIALLTQEHDAARDGARAVLGKINQDLERLVQPCWTTRRRRVNDQIAQLEIRGLLEGLIARGENAKMAVHPSMASRATAMVPKAIAMRLENSVSTAGRAMHDPDFVDRLVTLHPRRPDDRAPPACVHDQLVGEGSPGQLKHDVGALFRMLAVINPDRRASPAWSAPRTCSSWDCG